MIRNFRLANVNRLFYVLVSVLVPACCYGEYAARPNDAVNVVSPTVITKPPIAKSTGQWTYYPPTGTLRYGQYIYASPAGSKPCARNLTIHMATWMCATGYNTKQYLNSGNCIPNAYEMPAYIVDKINADTTNLFQTCVQLSAGHYDFSEMTPHQISEEFVEATNKDPPKHGWITGGDAGRANKIAKTAANVGVPHMEVHAQSVVITDISEKTTFFQTRSAANWLIPGLMDLVADRFALLVDTASAPDMFPAFDAVAQARGKSIALKFILPVFDGSNPTNTDVGTEEAIDLVLQYGIRYVVMGMSVAASYAVLGCKLYLRGDGLYKHFKLLGMATPGDVLLAVPGCSADELRIVIENNGMVASVAWPPNPADDILINRVTGGGFTGGGSWALDGTNWVDNGLSVTNSLTCQDNPGAAQNSATVLRLLNKVTGPVSCSELVPFGQSGWQPYMRQVAEFCPISACKWNSLMPACRISCACDNSALTMPNELGLAIPGGPLCIQDIADLPPDWLPAKHLRCDGTDCRRLDFGPSGWDLTMQFFEYARGQPPYWADSSVRQGFCANPYFCRNIPPWAVHFGVGLGVVDGVYALVKAWQCIESDYGVAGLQRVADSDRLDYDIAKAVISCIRNNVSFEGAQGKINFKYPPEAPHSPNAGWTTANILAGTRTDNNEQATVGYHTPDGAVIINRVSSRVDFTKCQSWKAEIMPGRTCPTADGQEEWILDDPSTHDVLPLSGPSNCPAGEFVVGFADLSTTNVRLDHCSPCPVGSFKSNVGPTKCQECEAGRFASTNGSTTCDFCPAGSFSLQGQAGCTFCRAGSFTSERGSQRCLTCGAGSFSGEGQSMCTTCSLASFAPANSSNCETCPGNLVTQYPGATVRSDCKCAVGSYKPVGVVSSCEPCPFGMVCPFGSDIREYEIARSLGFPANMTAFPQVKSGYYSPADEPLSVFRCRANPDQCKGGPPGTCQSNREGLKCFYCPNGWVNAEGGTCEKCDGANYSLFILACCVVPIVLIILYVAISKEDRAKTPSTKIQLVLLAGLAMLTLQQLGVVGTMAVTWGEPVKTVLGLANLLNFDVEVLKLSCIFGNPTPFVGYFYKALVILILLVCVVLVHFVYVALFHQAQFGQHNFTLIAVMGTILIACITAIVNVAIIPFQCDKQPNGSRTVQRYPTVLCGGGGPSEGEGGDFGAMMGLGVVLILCCLSFVGACAYIVYQFPTAMRSGNSLYLKKYCFLFSRFKPVAYWYVGFFVVRNLLLALSPMLPDLFYQVMLMVTILMVSVSLVARCLPWRVDLVSFVDVLLTICMNMTISFSGFFAEDPDTSLVGWFAFVFVLGILLTFVLCVAHTVHQHFLRKHRKEWKYFLCHHKGGAGAFARLCKITLLKTIGNSSRKFRVWIDCDDLTNLEMLFDYVGSQSENIVILMSKELFQRPWCMGELVTAMVQNTPMRPVRFPDFAELSDEFIDNYNTHVDISCLAPLGIGLEQIQAMLRFVREKPPLVLPLKLTAVVIGELAQALEAGNDSGLKLNDSKPDPCTNQSNVVVVDHTNWESVATALVLVACMRVEMVQAEASLDKIPKILEAEVDFPSNLQTAIFVLSNGAFFQPPYIKTMLGVEAKKQKFIPIISEDGFRFPSKTMLQEIKTMAPTIFAPAGITASPDKIAATVAGLFKEIAVVFSPQDYSSNEALLKVKAQAVVGRVSNGTLQPLDAKVNETETETKTETNSVLV